VFQAIKFQAQEDEILLTSLRKQQLVEEEQLNHSGLREEQNQTEKS